MSRGDTAGADCIRAAAMGSECIASRRPRASRPSRFGAGRKASSHARSRASWLRSTCAMSSGRRPLARPRATGSMVSRSSRPSRRWADSGDRLVAQSARVGVPRAGGSAPGLRWPCRTRREQAWLRCALGRRYRSCCRSRPSATSNACARWRCCRRPRSGACSPEAVAYRIFPERSTNAGAELLAGYCRIVGCDGYATYPSVRERLARDGPSFTIANCWAHARRGFVEAESAYPRAREILELIGKL